MFWRCYLLLADICVMIKASTGKDARATFEIQVLQRWWFGKTTHRGIEKRERVLRRAKTKQQLTKITI